MKKLFCFIILAFITISSCNSDETDTVIDPTKLAKVIFSPDTPYEKHWNFYANGLLKEVSEPDGTILQNFVYDANNNLLSSTVIGDTYNSHNFTYDINNHITSVDGFIVTYNQATNSYSIDYNPNNIIDEDKLDSIEIMLNNDFLITSERSNYLSLIATNYTLEGVIASYVNGNMTMYSDREEAQGDYNFDNNINPFRPALLPICRAMGITSFKRPYNKWMTGEYNSSNNVIFNNHDPDGPDKYEYYYDYNDIHLPKNRYSRTYEFLQVVSPWELSAIYYYQGDIIP